MKRRATTDIDTWVTCRLAINAIKALLQRPHSTDLSTAHTLSVLGFTPENVEEFSDFMLSSDWEIYSDEEK